MQINTSIELFDIRHDYTGELISQHTIGTDAEDALHRMPYSLAQDCSIWPHVEAAPDDDYLNAPLEFSKALHF